MPGHTTPRPGLAVTLWGVRGSIPTAGADVCRYGGHTPCVEVRLDGRLFIIDGGSGLIPFGRSFGDQMPAEIDLLFSHLHLDHIIGLPFFKPALRASERLTLHCGNLGGETAQQALMRVFSPPVFPVKIGQLPCRIEHRGFVAGETLRFADDISVRTIALNHPSGATGYRFDYRGRSFCYLSDLEHAQPWPDPALVDFVRGADLVLFDAMFCDQEYGACVGWGHSTWQKGIALARAGEVNDFGLFHHDPRHTDDIMEQIEAQAREAFPGAFAAKEGTTLHYPPL